MHLPPPNENEVVFETKDWIEMSSKKEKKWSSVGGDDPVEEEEEDETNYNNQRQLHKENVDHLITIREVPSSYLCWSVVSTLCCCFSCFRYELVENIN
jgi:hypothetical protein